MGDAGVTLTPIVSADGYVENFLADDANRDIHYCQAGVSARRAACGDGRSTGSIIASSRADPRSREIEPSLRRADHGGPVQYSRAHYPPFVYPPHLHR